MDAAAASPRSALPSGWPVILRAIAEGPEWKVRPKDLAKRLDRLDSRGRMLPTFAETLDKMHAACWLYRFEELRREYITLSGEAAERLGCELVDPEGGGSTRWSYPQGTTGPKWPRSSRRIIAESDLWVDALAEMPSREVSAERLAELREHVERLLAPIEAKITRGIRFSDSDIDLIDRVYPILCLIGSGSVWREKGMGRETPGRPWVPPRECDTCKLLPLPKIGICLRCLRWGWDEFFAEKIRRRRA